MLFHRNKGIITALSAMMIFLLFSACSSAPAAQMPDPTSPPPETAAAGASPEAAPAEAPSAEETAPPPVPEPGFPPAERKDPPETAFDVFLYFSDQVGTASLSDCERIVSEWGFVYTVRQPPRARLAIPDQNDFTLYIYFMANREGVQTISLLAYTDTNYEVDVSDSDHSEDVHYTIYDITQEPKNRRASSLEELAAFILTEVPQKTREYHESVSDNAMIEVEVDAEYELVDGKAFFTIRTNLPDKTLLTLTLKKDGSRIGRQTLTVFDGAAESEGFAEEDGPPSGYYTLLVVAPTPDVQEASVQQIIGIDGEFLCGQYVLYDPLFGGRYVSAAFDFTF